MLLMHWHSMVLRGGIPMLHCRRGHTVAGPV